MIHYRGLNCYLACIVSIAASLGVRYLDAFAALWSETEFAYDPRHRMYTSPRLLNGLRGLGVELETFPCATPAEAEDCLSRLVRGDAFLIGMDTFDIPWSPLYRHGRDLHYFFARKEGPESFVCFDPVYNQTDMPLTLGDLTAYAAELIHVRIALEQPSLVDISREAKNILQVHPGLIASLPHEIRACGEGASADTNLLIAKVDALICNRHLFSRFLLESPLSAYAFSGDFFLRWEAVKNGLIKASILKRKDGVADEASCLSLALLRDEMEKAREILWRDSGRLPKHSGEMAYIG